MLLARLQIVVPKLPLGKLGKLAQFDKPSSFVLLLPRVTCGISPPAIPPVPKSLNRCTEAELIRNPVLNAWDPLSLVKLSMNAKYGERRPCGSKLSSGLATKAKLTLKGRGKACGGRNVMLGRETPT